MIITQKFDATLNRTMHCTNALSPLIHCSIALLVLIGSLIQASDAWAQGGKVTVEYRAIAEEGFAMWVSQLRSDAEARGISHELFNEAMRDVTPDWSLPDLEFPDLGPDAPPAPKSDKQDKPQAEFGRPSSYIRNRSLSRIAKVGRKKLAKWAKTLAVIEKEYGVQKAIILAIWGRETGFGHAKIPHYAVRALATQAFVGRRKEFFRKELLLAFEILQAGHVTREQMASSWAGAMGHTQFLPSDFIKYAIDYDRDGRRDIWETVQDALASTANYLNKVGWESGKTWGYEVRLPKEFDCTLAGPNNTRAITKWRELGLERSFDREFRADRLKEQAFLVLPAGTKGPAFLALKNFTVIKRYNKADLYALYVGHLADRIYSDRTFEGRWAKVSGFDRSDVKLLQKRLADSGINVGNIDGLIGAQTRVAVGILQKKLALKPTCYPSRKLIDWIKAASN